MCITPPSPKGENPENNVKTLVTASIFRMENAASKASVAKSRLFSRRFQESAFQNFDSTSSANVQRREATGTQKKSNIIIVLQFLYKMRSMVRGWVGQSTFQLDPKWPQLDVKPPHHSNEYRYDNHSSLFHAIPVLLLAPARPT